MPDGTRRLCVPRTKVNETQYIPLPDRLAEVLDRYRASGRALPRWGERNRYSRLDALFDVAPELRQKGWGWHVFRRSLGSALASAGVHVKMAQEAMRHARPETTLALYMAVEPSKVKAEVDRALG